MFAECPGCAAARACSKDKVSAGAGAKDGGRRDRQSPGAGTGAQRRGPQPSGRGRLERDSDFFFLETVAGLDSDPDSAQQY